MTRPDKRAARFGDRYQPRLDRRRFLKALWDALPIVKRLGENLRHHLQAGARLQPSVTQPGMLTLVPHVAGMAAPTLAELEAGTPIRVSLHTSAELDDGRLGGAAYDTRYARSSYPATWSTAGATITGPFPLEPSNSRSLLDRIDDTLLTYDDAQRSTGQPWPFESF